MFASNNGGGNNGAVYFDVTTASQTLSIDSLDINTSGTGPLTVQVFFKVGTSVGFETTSAAWTLAATATGIGAGLNNPSRVVLDVPLQLTLADTYGIALVSTLGHNYTNGTGTNQNFSNADLSIALGKASNPVFGGTLFSPRIWNGTIYYSPVFVAGGAAIPTTSQWGLLIIGLSFLAIGMVVLRELQSKKVLA